MNWNRSVVSAVVLAGVLAGVGSGDVRGQETKPATTKPRGVWKSDRTPARMVEEVEAKRKSLALVEESKLDQEREAYLKLAESTGWTLVIMMGHYDDGILILAPAAALAKEQKSPTSARIEKWLATAKRYKAVLKRLEPLLTELANDPTNKETARLVAETYFLEIHQLDWAINVAKAAKDEELIEQLSSVRKTDLTAQKSVALADWLMSVAARRPALKESAHSSAFGAYQRAIKESEAHPETGLSAQEKQRIQAAMEAAGLVKSSVVKELPVQEIWKKRWLENKALDPRVVKIEAERKGVESKEKEKRYAALGAYRLNLENVAKELMGELKMDDAIAALKPALVTPNTEVIMRRLAKLLEKANAGKVGIARMTQPMKVLEKDPTNKEMVRVAVEGFLIELDRSDLALRIAQEGNAESLEALAGYANNLLGCKPSEAAAVGDWMVDVSKRTPTIRTIALQKAYEAYARALREDIDAPDAAWPEAERKRVSGLLRTLPAPTYFKVREMDTNAKGSDEIDMFFRGLDPRLNGVDYVYTTAQGEKLKAMLNVAFPAGKAVAFRGKEGRIYYVEPPNKESTGTYQGVYQVSRSDGVLISVRFEVKNVDEAQAAVARGKPYFVSGNIRKVEAGASTTGAAVLFELDQCTVTFTK